MRKLLLIAILLGACGDDEATTVVPDAEIVPPDADFSCRVLFLNFESTTLTAGNDDAPNDVSSIITGTQTVPAYRAADPDRDTKIAQIVTQVTSTLTPVGVTVVTTRPATGPYAMATMGGESTDIGLQAGFGGIAPFPSCGTGLDNQVLFSFQAVNGGSVSLVASANVATSAYLISFGTPTSDDPQDCLCWEAPGCGTDTACRIGGAATPRYDQAVCGSGATFDEPAVLSGLLACP